MSAADIGESYGEFRCLHGAVDALLLAEHGIYTDLASNAEAQRDA